MTQPPGPLAGSPPPPTPPRRKMTGLEKLLLVIGITVGVAFLALCALVVIVAATCSFKP